MALKIIRGRNLPIGLDMGSSFIKMAQLRQSEDNLELLAIDRAEIPHSIRSDSSQRLAFTAQAAAIMLENSGFVGRQCVLSLPAEFTFVQHVRCHKVLREQLVGAVEAELGGKLPFAHGDAVIRYIVAGDVLGEGDPMQEVVVIAASRSLLETYLDAFNKVHLDIVGVEIESCAVVECFARVFRRASDAINTTLFVDMGAVSTQFVLTNGSRIVFARNIAAGGDMIDHALAKQTHTSVESAHAMRLKMLGDNTDIKAQDELYRCLDGAIHDIAEEMTQCLRYFESVFRNQTIDRAIFVGGQAYDKRLCQAIAQKLNLPAQIGDPMVRLKRTPGAGVNLGLDWRQPQPAWAVAVGLSLSPTVAA